MNRTVVYGSLLVAGALAVGVSIGRRGERSPVESTVGDVASSAPTAKNADSRETGSALQLERRLGMLSSKLAAEAEQRHRLEGRLDLLAAELAAVRGNAAERGRTTPAETKPAAVALATNPTTNAAPDPASGAQGTTAMERALLAAGVDATTVSDIKRRGDELALDTIYLRDQATREGWLDTPGFAEEMAKIEQQRTPLRDEIGDDAYDRYLAALNHPNRVAVDEVLLESPAAVAGVQAGDVVLRYGDTRVFSPSELVDATRSGVAGETVRVEISRAGQRFEIEVPRGPLGVRIAATRGDPTGS